MPKGQDLAPGNNPDGAATEGHSHDGVTAPAGSDGDLELSRQQAAIDAANARLAAQESELAERYGTIGRVRQSYNESDVKRNGLCLGYLRSVTVEEVDISPKTVSMGSLAGMRVPVLRFNFDNGDADELKRKYHTHTFFPVESSTETFAGGAQGWRVTSQLQYFVHYIQTFITHSAGVPPMPTYRNIVPLINDAIYPEVDGKIDYKAVPTFNPVATDEVIADYARRFNAMCKLMNNGMTKDGAIREDNDPDAFPVFKDRTIKTTKNHIFLWLLLLRSTRVKGSWRNVNQDGSFGFPSFLGKGVIEVVANGVEPVLHFDSATMSHKAAPEKAHTGGLPPAGGGAFIPPAYGAAAGTSFAGASAGAGAYSPSAGSAGTQDDLPF
jgi:hypothetical protein